MCVKLKANSLCFIFSVIAVFYGTYDSTTNKIEKEKNYEKVKISQPKQHKSTGENCKVGDVVL